MKIVLDTNVLVSGLFPKKTPPSIVLDLIVKGHLHVCYNTYILSEYREVLLRPKFDFNKEHVDLILQYIRKNGYLVPSFPINIDLPDKDDITFLEAAIIGEADFLITGNMDHFPAEKCKNIKVVTPNKFLKIYKSKTNNKSSRE